MSAHVKLGTACHRWESVKKYLGSKEPGVCVCMITAGDAASILSACNLMNRKPGKKHVELLARLMIEDDQWMFNGETIKFSAGGLLIDGQHRLLAQVDAGIDMVWAVAFGLSDSAYLTIDANDKARRPADFIPNTTRPRHTTALSHNVLRHEMVLSETKGIHGGLFKRGSKFSKKEIVDRIDSPIEAAVEIIASNKWSAVGCARSVFTFCVWLTAQEDRDKSVEFAEMANSNLVTSMTNYMQKLCVNERRRSLCPELASYVYLHHWRAHVDGVKVARLRIPDMIPGVAIKRGKVKLVTRKKAKS